MSKSRSSSHGRWQGTLVEARLVRCLEGMGRLLSDRFTRAESRADIRRTRHDDAGSLAADDSHDPAPLLPKCAQSTQYRKPRSGAAYEAMEALSAARAGKKDARRICDKMCGEAAIAEIISATVDVFGKAEALEKQFKTVTMRADSLLVTESDFFQTILKRGTKKLRTT